MEKKLYRDDQRKSIGGVCAGLADYFNVDVAIVRLIFVLMLILHGTGVLAYVVLWIVLPRKTFTFNNPTVDYTVPPQTPGNTANQENPFKSNSFSNQSYSSQPLPNQPLSNQPFPRQHNNTSLVGIIFGAILIVVGGSILLDDFNIIPDWDFGRLWPIMIIAVGVTLIFAGEKRKPWEQASWQKTETSEATKAVNDTPEKPADSTVSTDDNTPAV